jgi:hypothetical protein
VEKKYSACFMLNRKILPMRSQEQSQLETRPNLMKKPRCTLLLLILLLSACSLPLTRTPPTHPATLTPTPESYGGNCGYQWAQKALPELSGEFQQAIQQLQPEAVATAFAFGEDCVYADGHAVFSAMETDFNITFQVSDLSNESDLGEWIVKVMQVIENIPPEKVEGPRPGRVSLEFRSGSEQKFVNFYIDQYQALPTGLSNAEIYQALQTPQ